MKLLFIPAKTKSELKVNLNEISKKLPKNISIAYSIQFKDIAYNVRKTLSEKHKHKITSIIQVLGCSNPKFSEETQAVLLIGSGKFHAVSLAFESKLPVYILNSDGLEKVSDEEVKALEKKHKAALLKFHNAEKIGVLISTKPGQQKFLSALKLKEKYKDKKFYLFINNDINIKEFENFRIDTWVNTACPRLDYDYPIINITELVDKKEVYGK